MGKGRHRADDGPRYWLWLIACVFIVGAGAAAVLLFLSPSSVQDPVPANTSNVEAPRHVDPKTTPEAQAYLDALKAEHVKPMSLDDLVTIGLGVCVQRTKYNVSHSTAAERLAASRKDISKIDAATIVNEADKYLCATVDKNK